MKKIIALILAVALSLSMASVAFAAELDFSGMTGAIDEEHAIGIGDEVKLTSNYFRESGTKNKGNASDLSNFSNYFSSEYFSTTVRWDKGGNYVESTKFDGDGNLVIKFKGDSIKVPTIFNLKLKELKVRANKDITRGSDTVKRNDVFEINGLVGAELFYGAPKDYTSYEVGATITADSKGLYVKFRKSGDISYDTSAFDFAGIAYGEVRVFEKEEIFVKANADVNKDIVKANEKAEIEFVNLTGKFSSSMTLEIFADEKELLYELKDGKLIKSAAKYDDSKNAFIIKTTTLGSYVISDIELVNAATATDDKNPDTGANDVVGVAVALAVVSLVAAGAVSLKK